MNAWGHHLHIDLAGCNPELIRSEESIRKFVIELCGLIEMKRFGEPLIVHFGESEEVSGYSLVQLIETSNICAHFVEQTNDAYIDIFSCKKFSIDQAENFCTDFFQAKDKLSFYMTRQAPNRFIRENNRERPDMIFAPVKFDF